MSATMDASCCCGRVQCAYWNYNNAIIQGLEKDLRGAAQVGQALLFRHESYIAEVEQERAKMIDNIEQLEKDKLRLETDNERTIEENRLLLKELEAFNHTVSDSDAHILSLTTTLQSTRHELERVTSLAARSTQLEAQLIELEREQQLLREQLASTESDERAAVHRWKSAERTINNLQHEVERIESEARDGRKKHEDVVSQYERQRLVGRDPDNAAGRLKSAAAATALENGSGRNSVVSHFVKDILQDNANLQMGIVELREMLTGSNEEVEHLREQMMLYQPAVLSNEDGSSKICLKSELARTSNLEAVPELHVHHHYHPAGRPKAVSREKSYGSRRPRNRRNFTTQGIPAPPSDLQALRTPSVPNMSTMSATSTAEIPSQEPATNPTPQPLHRTRWSVQSFSSIAPSTVPSSPQSAHRASSIFDSIDATLDTSRPTSPESITTGTGSPMFLTQHKRGISDISVRSLSTPLAPGAAIEPHYNPGTSRSRDNRNDHLDRISSVGDPKINSDIIPEEPEPDLAKSDPTDPPIPDSSTDSTPLASPTFRPLLGRSNSHESILSIAPISIQPLRQRSSQAFPKHRIASLTASSPQTFINPTPATAQPASHSLGPTSSNYNRSLLSTLTSTPSTPHPHSTASLKPPTFSRRVGEWVLGRWSIAPLSTSSASSGSNSGLRAKPATNLRTEGAEQRSTVRSSPPRRERAAGVNQKGAVRGAWVERVKAPRNVEIGELDEDLLRESLVEG